MFFIVPCLLMILWLPFYIWTVYNSDKSVILKTKLTASAIFLLTGIVVLIINPDSFKYAIFIVIAQIFGFTGDALLVFKKNIKSFKLGITSFLIGQILFGTVFLIYNNFSYITLTAYVVFMIIGYLVYKYTKINLGNIKSLGLVYYALVSFMFSGAISSLYLNGFNNITTYLIAIGGTLFFISDIMLAFIYFYPNTHKSLKSMNLTYYFIAQLLLSLSILYF